MRYGPLDRRISILRKSLSQTDSGAVLEAWRPLGSLARYASFAPVKGEERFGADQFAASEQVEFRVRFSRDLADLSPLDRIIEPGLKLTELDSGVMLPDDEIADRRQYDIMAVHEIGRREGLRILAARRVDGDVDLLEEVLAELESGGPFGAGYFGPGYFGPGYFGSNPP